MLTLSRLTQTQYCGSWERLLFPLQGRHEGKAKKLSLQLRRRRSWPISGHSTEARLAARCRRWTQISHQYNHRAVVPVRDLLGPALPTGPSTVSVTVYTVEPPNKGHFGSTAFVLYLEAVLRWEVQIINWCGSQCPLYGGCPLVGGSIIGGSTVYSVLMCRFIHALASCLDLPIARFQGFVQTAKRREN